MHTRFLWGDKKGPLWYFSTIYVSKFYTIKDRFYSEDLASNPFPFLSFFHNDTRKYSSHSVLLAFSGPNKCRDTTSDYLP